jgi:hypothetical protein
MLADDGVEDGAYHFVAANPVVKGVYEGDEIVKIGDVLHTVWSRLWRSQVRCKCRLEIHKKARGDGCGLFENADWNYFFFA